MAAKQRHLPGGRKAQHFLGKLCLGRGNLNGRAGRGNSSAFQAAASSHRQAERACR